MPKKPEKLELEQVTFYIEPKHRAPMEKAVEMFKQKMSTKTGIAASNFTLSQLLRLWIEKGAEDFIKRL